MAPSVPGVRLQAAHKDAERRASEAVHAMQHAERDASRCKTAMLQATEKLCSQQAELESSLHKVPPLLTARRDVSEQLTKMFEQLPLPLLA